ncbi:MAG: isoamylase early set domain-containing protein [Nitrospinae bacterium]|nr:isoamylase early set domain-containing protein [Nitrospinota bacterium]
MKEYFEGKKICRVTFRLPKSAAPNGKSVFIVDDFNNWNMHAHQMKKQKNGDHAISLNIAAGREYQFRYLIGGSKWENDWKADKYVRSPYGDCDNSVVVV